MKHVAQRLVVAAVLAMCAATASAQASVPAAPGTQAPGMMQGHGANPEQRMQRMQRRIESVRQTLQITPQQEAAFNEWTNAMRPAAKQRPSRDEIARMSTPERIDLMKQLRGARMAEMDKRGEATKAFYAQLTPAQQKSFDEISMRFMRGGRDGAGHGGRHRHNG